MTYDSARYQAVYTHTVEQIITRGLLEGNRKITQKGIRAVTQTLPGLEQKLASAMKDLRQVVNQPRSCEQDYALYTLACILWKDWNYQEKKAVRELAGRTNLHVSALPILAGAYLMSRATERVIIYYSSQNTLNLMRERTRGNGV
ncbi:MAG: hypothetical protein QT02_C0002G0034 [archaeon GW2011_AR9]|nr:MAG: hypothetical protein QT02_C0002G0034 [archaeon GW2011_AR9]MBS3120577.1 hypothetical protein [Candidatus Woesearchaeota archaeon]HIH12513.1 hypothetical protein [Candidatus Woesearchaeota archaeon]